MARRSGDAQRLRLRTHADQTAVHGAHAIADRVEDGHAYAVTGEGDEHADADPHAAALDASSAAHDEDMVTVP
jgi:hypothetical protein